MTAPVQPEALKATLAAAIQDALDAIGCELTTRCRVAAAAVVAALDLPGREREAAAKALDEMADRWQQGDGFTVMAPKGAGIPAIDYAQRALDWLRARASALREGWES